MPLLDAGALASHVGIEAHTAGNDPAASKAAAANLGREIDDGGAQSAESRGRHGKPDVGSDTEVLFAGGMWMFEQEGRLDRYRKRLQDDDSAQRLESSLSHARKAGLKVAAAEQLQRPPRPFTPDHPRAELSRYKGVTVGKESSPGAWLHSREALRRSLAMARAYAPLHAWLRDEICA